MMITIEQVEALAEQVEADEQAARAKQLRLIRAYARILAVREPDEFIPRACEISDEDGHYDNSYPPKIRLKDQTGPATIMVSKYGYEEIATSGGFYYEWRATTTAPGLYIDPRGRLFGAQVAGKGRFGQFAAHPGNCDVMLTVAWSERDESDIPTEELRGAETLLRGLAFPASVAA